MATGTTLQTPREKWLEAVAEADRIEAETTGLNDAFDEYVGVEIDPGRRETIAESLAAVGRNPVLVRAMLNPSVPTPEVTLQGGVNLYHDRCLSGPGNEAGTVHLSRVFKRVKAALGDLSSLALVDLKRKDGRVLRDFMLSNSRNGGGTLKPATVLRELYLVRAVVSMGIREFDLKGKAANRFEGLSVTPSNKAETVNEADMRDPLPPEVLDAMAERMKRGSNRNPDLGLVWRMLAGTGCSIAEVTGLRERHRAQNAFIRARHVPALSKNAFDDLFTDKEVELISFRLRHFGPGRIDTPAWLVAVHKRIVCDAARGAPGNKVPSGNAIEIIRKFQFFSCPRCSTLFGSSRSTLMKLSFFTMPIHPLGKPFAKSLAEDREAFILADKLGYAEAYCGEHTTDQAEIITSCVAFLASIAYETKNIRLGTGTVNMPNSHPARVAAEVAMLDHMLEGRLNFGISPGGLMSDAEVFGNLDNDRNAMFVECINMVLDIWAGEAPYNLKGDFWEVSTENTMMREIGQGDIMKPYQDPHPPIIGTVVAPFSKGVTAMAERGWQPISANFLLPKWAATHWPKYVEGCENAGLTPDYANWRVAKNICVADDMETARAYARDPGSPYVLYYSQLLTKLRAGGRLNLFKEDQNMDDDEVTLDYVLDRLVIHGDPSSVADQILALREATGPFKHLVYAGHDWADYDLGRKGMVLMAEKVMPLLTEATKSEPAAAAA